MVGIARLPIVFNDFLFSADAIQEPLVFLLRGQVRPGRDHMTPSACVRAAPHSRSAEGISAQTGSEASKGDARNRMTPYRFQ